MVGACYHAAMRIIARRTLRDYVGSRAGRKDQGALKAALDAWFSEAEKASWGNMAAIKKQYGTASPVTADRVVFNIKGNDYRLIAAVAYRFQAVYIKFIGTHAQYDRIDAATVEDP